MASILGKAKATFDAIDGIRVYFETHRNNQRLLSVTAIFAQNVSSAVHRLQCRQWELDAHPSEALDSLMADFDSALAWIHTNQESLQSKWSVAEAAQQLQDLDGRLARAFARKISLAVFESVQENRALSQQISLQLDHLAENLPQVIEARLASSSHSGIEKALAKLREEETQSRPSKEGFANDEVEKVIASLIDTITRLQESANPFEPEAGEPIDDSEVVASPSSASASDSDDHQTFQVPQVSIHSAPDDAGSEDEEDANAHTPLLGDDGLSDSPLDGQSMRKLWSSISPSHSPAPSMNNSSEHVSRSNSNSNASSTSPPSYASRRSSTSRSSTPTATASATPPSETPAIGFLPIDAKTKKPLIDPILCADGSIRDRFEVISQAEALLLKKSSSSSESAFPALKERKRKEKALQIVGDILTFRLAIWASFPDRQAECESRRQAFKSHALNFCGPEGHSQPARAIFALSHVLAYEPEETSAHLLVRRALLHYRLRNLEHAEQDLGRAMEVSARGSRRNVDPDARRYRAWIRFVCNNKEGAWADLQEMLYRARDPLCMALKGNITAGDGAVDEAKDCIDQVAFAMLSFEDWASDIARQNMDLIYIARGWALMSIGQYSEAISDFDVALERRLSVDPYVLASKGLALIIYGDVSSGASAIEAAQSYVDILAPTSVPLSSAPSAISTIDSASPLSPTSAFSAGPKSTSTILPATWTSSSFYDVYHLRGMASYIQQDYQAALEAFEKADSLRPAGVKETGESRYVLGCIRASLGMTAQAKNDFDWAAALKPSQAEFYHYESAQMCTNQLEQLD